MDSTQTDAGIETMGFPFHDGFPRTPEKARLYYEGQRAAVARVVEEIALVLPLMRAVGAVGCEGCDEQLVTEDGILSRLTPAGERFVTLVARETEDSWKRLRVETERCDWSGPGGELVWESIRLFSLISAGARMPEGGELSAGYIMWSAFRSLSDLQDRAETLAARLDGGA